MKLLRKAAIAILGRTAANCELPQSEDVGESRNSNEHATQTTQQATTPTRSTHHE